MTTNRLMCKFFRDGHIFISVRVKCRFWSFLQWILSVVSVTQSRPSSAHSLWIRVDMCHVVIVHEQFPCVRMRSHDEPLIFIPPHIRDGVLLFLHFPGALQPFSGNGPNTAISYLRVKKNTLDIERSPCIVGSVLDNPDLLSLFTE